jgi:hypothetical protein
VRVTLFVAIAVERTVYVSPPTKTVNALAGAVELDKFSLKTIGTVVPVLGTEADAAVGPAESNAKVELFVTS